MQVMIWPAARESTHAIKAMINAMMIPINVLLSMSLIKNICIKTIGNLCITRIASVFFPTYCSACKGSRCDKKTNPRMDEKALM